MTSTEEPLTKRERAELSGYVSPVGIIVRALLFVGAITIVAVLARAIWHATGFGGPPVWLLPATVVGVLLYRRAGRWTGGPELRRQVRRDLEANIALVHHVQARDAILFEEREDEGPVVFVQIDSGETLVFVGQDLARHVSRGFPWREFEIREAPHSQRVFGFGKRGDPLPPSVVNPPLSPESYMRLGLASVRFWKRLETPFDQVRQLA